MGKREAEEIFPRKKEEDRKTNVKRSDHDAARREEEKSKEEWEPEGSMPP